ncbi:MAG: class I SAM-dependent RNA methyltransferase [Rhodospirillaceae bacterium]|nr:class I SAM-dependent RNA methyltransferase [Rhodospirillaceae bacterium]
MAQRRVKPSEIELEIAEIGNRGDAIAHWQGSTVYVPGGAPGDRLRVRLAGKIAGGALVAEPLELVHPGPARQTPPCRHFGACGGCRLQHIDDPTYAAWKTGQVARALAHRGLDAIAVAPLVRTPPDGRRRARLAARRSAKGVFLGFHEGRSQRIVDLAECHILEPRLFALLDPLRAVLAEVLAPAEPCGLMACALDDGIDLVIEAARPPDLAAREALAGFAHAQDLARLSWRIGEGEAEPVCARRSAVLRHDGVAVAVPPGPFLQASRAAEAVLTAAVVEALDGCARVADLFCGLGAFALPLSRHARVLAADSDGAAVAALAVAAQAAGRPVEAHARNLYSRPLGTPELAALDAVVLDPPRLGARDQVAALAASPVPVVAMVSCNPATFARDARLLVDGGYACPSVMPVDQFVWSPHVELLGIFRR